MSNKFELPALDLGMIETDPSKYSIGRTEWEKENLTLPIRKDLKEKYIQLQQQTCRGFGKSLQEAVEAVLEKMQVGPHKSA